MVTSANVAQEFAALADEPRDSLIARWERAYRCAPPAGVRQELLVYSAAWHLQAKRLGGFSVVTRRLLNLEIERIKTGASFKGQPKPPAAMPEETGTVGAEEDISATYRAAPKARRKAVIRGPAYP